MPNAAIIASKLPAHKQQWFTGKVHFVTPTRFLRGLLPYVKAYLDKNKISYVMYGEPDPLKHSYKLKSLSGEDQLMPYQERVVNKLFYEYQGIVQGATNAGKSYIMAGFLQSTRIKTLVIVHRIELKDQVDSGLIFF
jgi:superfamily II DNA or RNA helicase